MMGVEDDKFFPIGGGVGIMSHLQGLSMDQVGTSVNLSWEHLAQKEPWCTSDEGHWVGGVLTEVNTAAIIS